MSTEGMMKHVGMFANTGRKCVVIMLQLKDETGNVLDPETCLAIDTDALPPHHHEALMSILNEQVAQDAFELHNVLSRRISRYDGTDMISSLGRQYIRSAKIDEIVMCPRPGIRIPLRRLLEEMKLLKPSNQPINNELQQYYDNPGKKFSAFDHNRQALESEHNNSQAQSLLAQAQMLEEQARQMRERATMMNPMSPTGTEQHGAISEYVEASPQPQREAPNVPSPQYPQRQLREDQFSKQQDALYGNWPNQGSGQTVHPNDPYAKAASMVGQGQQPNMGMPQPTQVNEVSASDMVENSLSNLESQMEQNLSEARKRNTAKRQRKKASETKQTVSKQKQASAVK